MLNVLLNTKPKQTMKAYYLQTNRQNRETYTFDVWQDILLTNLFTDLGVYSRRRIKITTAKFKTIVDSIGEYIPQETYTKLKEDCEDSVQNNRRFVYYNIK